MINIPFPLGKSPGSLTGYETAGFKVPGCANQDHSAHRCIHTGQLVF